MERYNIHLPNGITHSDFWYCKQDITAENPVPDMDLDFEGFLHATEEEGGKSVKVAISLGYTSGSGDDMLTSDVGTKPLNAAMSIHELVYDGKEDNELSSMYVPLEPEAALEMLRKGMGSKAMSTREEALRLGYAVSPRDGNS